MREAEQEKMSPQEMKMRKLVKMFDTILSVFLEDIPIEIDVEGLGFDFNAKTKKFTFKDKYNTKQISSYLRTCCPGHMSEDFVMTIIEGMKISLKLGANNVHVVLPYELGS